MKKLIDFLNYTFRFSEDVQISVKSILVVIVVLLATSIFLRLIRKLLLSTQLKPSCVSKAADSPIALMGARSASVSAGANSAKNNTPAPSTQRRMLVTKTSLVSRENRANRRLRQTSTIKTQPSPPRIIKTVMVMCHNVKKPNFQGKFDIAEQCLDRSKEAGFTQFLMDTAVLDLVEPGPCGKAIWMLKDKYGYPAGCSPTHIVIDRWPQGRDKYGRLGYITAKTSMATSTMMMGADFFMYGIKQTEIVPAMAMVDSCIAYTARQLRIRPKVKVSPLTSLMAQADANAEIRQ